MISKDIIESSQSPYTSPIVAIQKKNGKVRLCLDAREINKMIINDRTSPGEIDEILNEVHYHVGYRLRLLAGGVAPVSYTHLDVYKRQPVRSTTTETSLYKVLWKFDKH